MTNDTLFKDLETKLEDAGVSKTAIDNFLEMVKNNENINFGLANTIASGNQELASEILNIVEKLKENHKNMSENEENLDNSFEEIAQVMNQNDNLSIPWDRFKTFDDFEKTYNIDHVIGLKLISDLKIYSTISPDTMNSVLDNENIKQVLYGNFNWNDEELQLLNQAFFKEFIAFVNRVIKKKELVVNNEILNLKNKKIAEMENLKRIEQEKAARNMSFELLKASSEDLRNVLDKLYNLNINEDVLNSLFINYETVSKNMIHVTQNYIEISKISKTENENEILLFADNILNEASKYIESQKKINSVIKENLNKLFALLANYQELDLSGKQKEYLDVVNSAAKDSLGVYYNNYIILNRDYFNFEVTNIYDFLNDLANNSKNEVEVFKKLLGAHFEENGEDDKLSKLDSFELSKFIADENTLKNFNLLSGLENNYKEEEKHSEIGDNEETVDKSINKDDISSKVANQIEKTVNNLKELNELESQVDTYLSIHEQSLKDGDFLGETIPDGLIVEEENSKKIKLPEKAIEIFVKLRDNQRKEFSQIEKEFDNIPLEHIVDEILKIDNDSIDIENKIKNVSVEETAKYKKMLKQKKHLQSYLLSKLLVVENYKKLDDKNVLKLKEYAKKSSALSEIITDLDNSVNSTQEVKEESKKNDVITKEDLNELRNLVIRLKGQGIDVNQVIEQINTLDEKEKIVEDELNSRKK